jgi:DNA-binding MarR family transcriptional regulator
VMTVPTRVEVVEVDETTARLYLTIGRLSRLLRRTNARCLGHGSVSALATLVSCGPMRLGDLAAREGVAAPTLSRMMASLVDAGYACREPDPADGRASLVTATELGERVVCGLRSERMQDLQERLRRLSGEQRELLLAALPALEELIEEPDTGS